MLQAHNDGSKLIVHETELYDFTKGRNGEALTLFTRWAASDAVGHTRPGIAPRGSSAHSGMRLHDE